MCSWKGRLSVLFIVLLFVFNGSAQNSKSKDEEVLKNSIRLLKDYFSENGNWHVVKPEVARSVDGLINFIEDQSIDTIIKQLNEAKKMEGNYVLRLPENVEDSLNVPGYVSAEMRRQNITQISARYKEEVKIDEIMVPASVVEQAKAEVETIPEGKGIQLFVDSVYTLPDSLLIPEVIPDSVLTTPDLFNKLVRIDSLRNVHVESKRKHYNDSVTMAHVNTVIRKYRMDRYDRGLNFRVRRYTDSVTLNNYQVLSDYNNKVIAQVNDTIKAVIDVLAAYADFTDTTRLQFLNLAGDRKEILLQNNNQRFSRMWLKNEQNDSLRILVKNIDKNTVSMLIDDGVTFSRIKEQQSRDFDFESLKQKPESFSKVGKSYKLETPWQIGGEGNVGFSQTYLDNWQKGGQSSLATLIVLNGFANNTRKDGKIKWENSAEIRSGWIRNGGSEEELQKNDDKFEVTSRYGVSAFKKWYYSTELTVNTQLFRGYKYPKSENPEPISAFMAPIRTYFKLGLDYKPNKDLSLFLSPLTLKNVYVRDTSLVDQTRYGIDENEKSFWEPGFNAEIRYKKNFTENISYQTKYKMFINYQNALEEYDINWENIFKMKLNNYIGMQLMLHFIYDDDVLFPVYDDDGNPTGEEETRLQIKEYFSIGFTYKINKKVERTHRIR